MNRVVRMTDRCWEVTSKPASDMGWPHCATEQEARALVDECDECDECDDLTVTVSLLPAPCWEALCGVCGSDMADEDGYLHIHYRHAIDAETDARLSCESGCEPAGLDPWVPSTVGMEPIPGIEAVS